MCICVICKCLRSRTLDLQLDLVGASRVKLSQAYSVGSLQKLGGGGVYFGIEARMDSFAAVTTTS
jgi:hypothetical protein